MAEISLHRLYLHQSLVQLFLQLIDGVILVVMFLKLLNASQQVVDRQLHSTLPVSDLIGVSLNLLDATVMMTCLMIQFGDVFIEVSKYC